MKTVLFNCHGKLHCTWKELRCNNPIPGAKAATVIQSCAYDTQAMITTLEKILLPKAFAALADYPDLPKLYTNDQGDLLWPGEDEYTPR
jgi:hypothetical protein